MIVKIRDNYGDGFDYIDKLQQIKLDVRIIQGACIFLTRWYKVAGPMVSHIVRNGSCFKVSHDFTNIMFVELSTIDGNITDYIMLNFIDQNDKTIFFYSHASNYIHQPEK